MDMQAKPRDQLVFHLSGKRQGDGLAAAAGLWPALLAPYRELQSLRHDFPVVLVDGAAGDAAVRTLTSLVDEMLAKVAPRGIDGERLRRHALQLEREIRSAAAAGVGGTLGELWAQAAATLGAREGQALEQVLEHAFGALGCDGEVLGCDAEMPAKLLRHAWRAEQRAKARRLRAELGGLVLKVSDILRAADSHSRAGREPQALRRAFGGPHRDAFDFDALSRFLAKGVPHDELPPARRARLSHALAVLETQRLVPPPDAEDSAWATFEFTDCAAAARAFGERLGDIAALVKAMAVVELEVCGRYVEAEHDLVFEALNEATLGAADIARFPDYLVCIPPQRNDAPENANLMDMLSSGMPVKVLVQSAELLEPAAVGTGHYAFGVRSARLATAAMGLGGMFVLQSAASNLVALRPRIAHALASRSPALFSVYAAAPEAAAALPPYLLAAAAMQSRAFPAFSYDAAAGPNWATRFSLENNPQPDGDWPLETIEYADAALQRVREPAAFTYADYVLGDPRHAAHFAVVPRERWNAAMLPAADWLALDEHDAAEHVPYVLAVDTNDALQRVIVDAWLMQAARRCLLLWHRLQEHGGVNDSHAERLLERERQAWAAQQAPAAAAAPAAMPGVAAAAAASPGAADAPPETPAHTRDEAWIETARCPSCNECQLINDRLFGYDDRKQAYIKDLAAGTYRQLVEAAESCQVAIIHPGAPRDPNEPGLEELLVRAEPFR